MARNVVKAFQVKWSLWRYAAPAGLNALLSVVCYGIGWHLSDHTSAMPLQRAGAAATVFAIGFTLYDYRRSLEASARAAAKTFKKVTDNLPMTGSASQDRIDRKLESNTQRAVRAIRVMDAVVLMLATFVWGFGDLAARWM